LNEWMDGWMDGWMDEWMDYGPAFNLSVTLRFVYRKSQILHEVDYS